MYRLENPNLHKCGSTVILETNAFPIIDKQGNLLGYRGADTDITERKRVEEDLKIFRALMNQSNDAIEIVDPYTGDFIDVNERAWKDLGYCHDEFLSMKVFDVS